MRTPNTLSTTRRHPLLCKEKVSGTAGFPPQDPGLSSDGPPGSKVPVNIGAPNQIVRAIPEKHPALKVRPRIVTDNIKMIATSLGALEILLGRNKFTWQEALAAASSH